MEIRRHFVQIVCIPVNIAKFLRTVFFIEQLRRLLLNITQLPIYNQLAIKILEIELRKHSVLSIKFSVTFT